MNSTKIVWILGKPDAMSGCTVVNETSDSLLIKCVAGFDGGSRQRFVVEVYKKTENVQNLSNDSPEFLVTGLRSNVVYNFVIYALNSKGRSQAIEFNETLNDDNDEGNNLKFPGKKVNHLPILPAYSLERCRRALLWQDGIKCFSKIESTNQPCGLIVDSE